MINFKTKFTLLICLSLSHVVIFVLSSCHKEEAPSETDTDTGTSSVDSDLNFGNEIESSFETNSSTDTETPQPSVPEVPVENTTFQEFMEQHGAVANQFAIDHIEQISYNDNALSTTYTYIANENAVEKIIVAQIVAGEGTTRELKIAEISFNEAVDFDDIVSGEAELMPIITSETVLTFDAKEEYKKGEGSTIAEQIADEIAENLGEDAIEIEQYQAETFAPATVEDLVKDYKNEVNTILNNKSMQKIIDSCFVFGFDASNVQSGKWVLEGDKQVTGIKYLVNYHESEQSGVVNLVSLKLSSAVELDDFLAGDFTVSEANWDYDFYYNPTIQGTRDELMNAIFKANGMSEACPEGAIRLITVGSSGPDALGYQCQRYTVVEIAADGIVEFGISAKLASTDAQYISNIQHGYYRIYGEKTADISGEEVEYSSSAAASATNASRNTK